MTRRSRATFQLSAALAGFKAARDQQNFAGKHPDMANLRINDVPGIRALNARFPRLYREP